MASIKSYLWTNVFLILTMLVAVVVRLVPVVLSWPYAVGFDTNALYIPAMIKGPPDIQTIFTYPGLHFLVLWVLYRIYPQPFVILDVLGVFLQGTLALSLYLYVKRAILLSNKHSAFASIVFTVAPITLRLTWDQYRMSLCLAAIMFAFIAIEAVSNRKKILAIPLTMLVILVNPLPAVLLLIAMLTHGLIKLREKKPFAIELTAALIGIAIFLVQQVSVTASGRLATTIPIGLVTMPEGLNEGLYGLGYLIFTSWPLLILAPLGWKTRDNQHHSIWLYSTMFFALVALLFGVITIPPPFTYLMISFPLSVLVGRALMNHHRNPRFKILFAIVLLFLLTNAVTYVDSSPLSPTPYTNIGQSFRYYMPMGYLQSTVPTSYEADLIQLLTTALATFPSNSTFYVPEQFYGFALMLPNTRNANIVNLGEVDPWIPSPFSLIRPGDQSYTIWFAGNSGWYGVSTVPSNFIASQIEGPFALYKINS